MDEKTWTRAVIKLFDFFRIKELPKDNQIKIWFDMIQHIPNTAADMVVNEICQKQDTLPRNLTKAFLEYFNTIPANYKKKEYDPTEDFSFPIAYLHQGLEVLERKGLNEFIGFANSVSMPKNDRDRVIFKNQVISGQVKIKLPEVGIRLNPKVNRPAVQTFNDDIPF